MPVKCKNSTAFYIALAFLVGFDTQVAKTPAYPVMCPFPVFIALCDHNPPTLEADGQTSCLQQKTFDKCIQVLESNEQSVFVVYKLAVLFNV